MKNEEVFLRQLWEQPIWREMLERIESKKPSIPRYDPKKDNTEEWKHASAIAKGYELCLAHLRGKSND